MGDSGMACFGPQVPNRCSSVAPACRSACSRTHPRHPSACLVLQPVPCNAARCCPPPRLPSVVPHRLQALLHPAQLQATKRVARRSVHQNWHLKLQATASVCKHIRQTRANWAHATLGACNKHPRGATTKQLVWPASRCSRAATPALPPPTLASPAAAA